MSAASAANLEDQPEGRSSFRGIVRNSIWLYSAEILTRVMVALLLVIVARRLGPGETGKYLFVASLTGIANSVADFGSTQYLIRTSVHAQASERDRLFWLVLGFRIALTFCLAACLIAYGAMTTDGETRVLLLLAAVSLPIGAAPGVMAAVLRSQERMNFEAIGKVVAAGLTLLVGGALILRGFGIVSLGFVGVLAAMAALAYYAIVPAALIRVRRPIGLDWRDLHSVARGAWPFFSMTILVVIYSRLDIVLLQQLMGPKAVGEYGVTVRVMEVFFVIPSVLGIAIFPSIAKNVVARPALVVRRGVRGMQYLVLASLPIALAGSILGPALFAPVFGPSFNSSGLAFRILVWTIVPVFASTVTSSIIAASRAPIVNTYLAAGMVVICVVGNLILVPRFGISGAAVVRLVTELSGLIGGSIFIATRIAPLRAAS